jgi:hypothetical protein
MSKLEQVEINLDLNEEVHNWKLVREGDGLTKTSSKVKWIEWDDKQHPLQRFCMQKKTDQ